MGPIISSHEVFVCQTCGDKGFTNAFVYCVKCLEVVIHRYCLNVMPTTFNERVLWYCEDCKETVGNQKEEAPSSGQIKTTNRKKKQKKERDITSIIAGTEPEAAECILSTDTLKEASIKLKSRHKRITSSKPEKRKKIAARLDIKKKEHKLRNGLKTETQKACTTMAESIKHSKNGICRLDEQTHESGLPQPPCELKELSSDSPSMKEESDETTNHERQVEKANQLVENKQDVVLNVSQSADLKNKQDVVLNVSQSADFENKVPCGQPIIDPVWRGSFSIVDKDHDIFEGFVAHLSTKACDKVYKEASILPSLLQLEMHPKTVLWPKSFQECEPSDVNIALYFFPGDQINEKDFDHLVIDMMNEGLAMRAMAANAELLIFTSRVLPQLFWRFQGKYYLWGVFRAKKNRSSLVASHDVTVVNNSDKHGLSKGSPNEVLDVKAVTTRVKTLDSHSPRSPLNNNGENGVDMDPESGD